MKITYGRKVDAGSTARAARRIRPPFVALLLLLTAACWPESDTVTLRGHVDECALVIFEAGLDEEAVNAFASEHVCVKLESRSGLSHREGVRSMIRREVGERVAYEVCFDRDAPLDLRRALYDECRSVEGVEEVRRVEVDPETGAVQPGSREAFGP